MPDSVLIRELGLDHVDLVAHSKDSPQQGRHHNWPQLCIVSPQLRLCSVIRWHSRHYLPGPRLDSHKLGFDLGFRHKHRPQMRIHFKHSLCLRMHMQPQILHPELPKAPCLYLVFLSPYHPAVSPFNNNLPRYRLPLRHELHQPSELQLNLSYVFGALAQTSQLNTFHPDGHTVQLLGFRILIVS